MSKVDLNIDGVDTVFVEGENYGRMRMNLGFDGDSYVVAHLSKAKAKELLIDLVKELGCEDDEVLDRLYSI